MSYKSEQLKRLRNQPVTVPYNAAEILYLNSIMLRQECSFSEALMLADPDILASIRSSYQQTDRKAAMSAIDADIESYTNKLMKQFGVLN
jgi:hypothetical protein